MKIDEQKDDQAIFAEIGVRVRHARIRARLKQEELAARCGISRFAVMGLERGAGGTKLSTLVAVLRQLRLLHGLDAAFPEVGLTPLELAELESRAKDFPKTVRSRREGPRTHRAWGDGTKIEEKSC